MFPLKKYTRKKRIIELVVSFIFIFKIEVYAQTPNPLSFNTGIDASLTTTAAIGSFDNIWQASITSSLTGYTPAVVCGNVVPSSWTNSPYGNANWISYPHNCPQDPQYPCCLPAAYQNCDGVTLNIYYKATFNLPTALCGQPITNPNSYCLAMNFFADNCVYAIYINGVQKYLTSDPNPPSSFDYSSSGATTFLNCSGWQSGTNEIIVHVVSTVDYEGFLCQVNTTSSTQTNNNSISIMPTSPVVCGGSNNNILTATGGTSYTWSPSGIVSNTILVSQSVTTTYTVNGTDASGCAHTATTSIQVSSWSATPNFSATTICEGLSTVFTDLSTPTNSISSWQWDFTNDGTIDSSIPNPTYTYSNSGTYIANLKIGNGNGCSSSFTLPVVVNASSPISISYNPVCYGSTMSFSAVLTPSNSATTYTYNFDDGGQAMLQNPIHLYTIASNATLNTIYTVTVTANTNGCISTTTLPVTMYAIPNVSFTFTPVCFNTASPLISTSNGNGSPITNYSWDFTNDNNADVNGPSNLNFTFTNIGNNPVTLTITTTPTLGLTCKSFTTQNVMVLSNPTAAFTFTNVCINAPSHTFDASTSSTTAGTLTNYAWSFGDGQISNSLAANASHTYTISIFYTVTLTVTTSNGCINTTSQQIEVYPKPSSNITSSNACMGIATSFSTSTLSGNINNWEWDVNNSITSIETTGQQSSFLFPSSGAHTLHLITTTTNNCKDTTQQIITVNEIPTASFSVNDPAGCSEHCVLFSDLSPAMPSPEIITNWEWSFGNGLSANATTNAPQLTCYENNSSSALAYYTVTLSVTSNNGCKASLVKPNYITVYPSPIANYNVIPDLGNVLVPQIDFTNQSIDYTKWYWSFGDGPQIDSIHVNPTYNYGGANTGTTYYTYLIVANQYGCTDRADKPVKIEPEFTFYIPNTFTPNGDNANDVFTGMGIGIAEYEMEIFDRWGANIFQTDDIHKGWDGRMRINNNEVQQDVYVWKVKIKDVFNKTHDYVGHVTLLR